MNALDIGLVILLAIGTVMGLVRGLVRIVIGLITIVVAFFLASRYQDPLAATLMTHSVSQTPARIAAYAIVFIATMIAGGLVAWVVGRFVKLAMLSFPDRLAGGAVGLLAALLAAAFLVHPLVASSPGGSRLVETSKLAPYVTVVADVANAVAPDAVARRYDDGIESLRRVWRGEMPVEKVKKAMSNALEKGEKAVADVKEKVAKDPQKKP